MRLSRALAVCASVLLMSGAAYAGSGHKTDYLFAQPGDTKKPAREILITMTENNSKMLFSPDKIEVKKGEQVRFRLKNGGLLDHEIVLATLQENLDHAKEMDKNPDMEHDNPNAKRLKPDASGEIVWKFTKAGTFDFSCLIPGHRQAGMFGTVTVK